MSEPIRIIHLSDLHLDERDPRFDRHCDVLRSMVDMAAQRAGGCPAAWLVTGDVFGHDTEHATTLREREAFADILQRTAVAPVVIVRGNHDGRGEVRFFRRLGTVPPSTADACITVHPVTIELTVVAVPWPRLGDYVSSDVAPAERAARAQRALETAIRSACERARNNGGVVVLAGHLAVAGARAGVYEVSGADVMVVSRAFLESLPIAAACLGHIHEGQSLGPRIHYAGSPVPLRHGEGDEKGFSILTVSAGDVGYDRFVVPSWRMVTVDYAGEFVPDLSHVRDAYVRCRVHGALTRSQMATVREQVLAAGAFDVVVRTADEEHAPAAVPPPRSMTDEERIAAALKARGVLPPEDARALSLFGELRGDDGRDG